MKHFSILVTGSAIILVILGIVLDSESNNGIVTKGYTDTGMHERILKRLYALEINAETITNPG